MPSGACAADPALQLDNCVTVALLFLPAALMCGSFPKLLLFAALCSKLLLLPPLLLLFRFMLKGNSSACRVCASTALK